MPAEQTAPSAVRARLAKIPVRRNAHWQYGAVRLWKSPRDETGSPVPLAVSLCVNQTGVIVAQPDVLETPIDAARCAREVVGICERLRYRPAALLVCEASLADELRRWLPPDTRVVHTPEPAPQWLDAYGIFGSVFGPRAPAGIFEDTGVTPEQMHAFCVAAATFYRNRPWKILRNEWPLVIDAELPETLPHVLVVMGAADFIPGMSGFLSMDNLRDMVLEQALPTGWWGLTFQPARDLPADDARLFAEHGWPVAFKKAHPMLIWMRRLDAVRHAHAEELPFFTQLMPVVATSIRELAAGKTVRLPLDLPGRGRAEAALRLADPEEMGLDLAAAYEAELFEPPDDAADLGEQF